MTSKEIQGTAYGLARNMQAKRDIMTALDGLVQNKDSQKSINQLYNQRVCEKHDYVTVTQITSTMVGGLEVKNTKKNWIQCRKCGKTIPSHGQL